MSSELSGRVSSLETRLTYLIQDMLQRPDMTAFSNLNILWNQYLSNIDSKYQDLIHDVSKLESLYSNLVLSYTGSYIVSGSTGSYQETFETINQNLNQYDYFLNYSGEDLVSKRYNISDSQYILKLYIYSGDKLKRIELTGSPIPSVSLYKNFYYSGEILTGVEYT